MVRVGLNAAYVVSGGTRFDLKGTAKYDSAAFPNVGVLAVLWLHSASLLPSGITWPPTGHVAAPTAASMLLAGVVMKLGAYGCLRVAMTLFPEGLAAWKDFFAIIAVIGDHLRRDGCAGSKGLSSFVIGYSSVSHMGFVLLRFDDVNTIGMSGAVLQMFFARHHRGLLFAVVGRMVYDRTPHAPSSMCCRR